jgi:hypothetical protein
MFEDGLSLLSPKGRCSQLLTLPWMLTWVLILPLFHIHILDIQEDLSQSQAFLPHTVFSADLPGEYTSGADMDQHGMPGNQRALSSHFLQYSELAILLLHEDDTGAKYKIGISPIHYSHFPSLRRSPLDIFQSVIPELASPPFLLLTSSVSSRAPPVCLL